MSAWTKLIPDLEFTRFLFIQVPANRGTDLAAMDDVTWLLFPFFYFPVGFGFIYCIIAIVYRIFRCVNLCWQCLFIIWDAFSNMLK